MTSVDTYVEMFLRTVSTGATDWTAIKAPLADRDVIYTDGSPDLNSEPGTPNRCSFSLHDPSGDFNRKNPMGAYYGSIGLGVQTRVGVWSVDDQCTRTVANTNWGSVGNAAVDTWSAGSSSGGSVTAADWSVASGTARHSIPATGAYRWSELSKTTRLHKNVEVRRTIKCPTSNVTGTGALASEIWLRTLDVNNNVVVSIAWLTDETIQIALGDKIGGTTRYLKYYTTIAGLSLGTTGVDYEVRCQAESSTVRAKIWPVGTPEPVGWHVTGQGATIREGYLGIADFVFSGNTNSLPLVFQTSQVQVRIPVAAGAISKLRNTGNDKGTAKLAEIQIAGPMDRLQSNAAPAESAMRRSRSRGRRWMFVNDPNCTAGTTRTATVLAVNIGNIRVGDFFFLNTQAGSRKEDTQFFITGLSLVGSDVIVSFTPDAREAVTGADYLAAYRGITSTEMPTVYWPMEDEDHATQISSGLVDGVPMSIQGSPDFASDSSFFGSKPILRLNDAELNAAVPDYTSPDGYWSWNFLLSMPSSDEAASNTDLLQFYTTGTGWSWDLQYSTSGGGSLRLLVISSAGATLFDSGAIDYSLRGASKMVTLVLQDVLAGTVTYRLFTRAEGSLVSGGVGPSTVTGVTTLGKITQVRANPAGGYRQVGFGHLTGVPALWDRRELLLEFLAYNNQSALHRHLRLAFEDNIAISYRDDWDVVATNMGAQLVSKIPDLLKQPAKSDGGIFHGMAGAYELEFITRGALTNQTPAATFPAADCQELDIDTEFTEVENRVSVTRIGGTTTMKEETTGPLSIQDAPVGAGLKEQGYSLSLGSDVQTIDQANFRLGLGTLDQPRVSRVVLTSAGSSSVSLDRLLSIGVGERIDITDLSSFDIYDDLPQLVVGKKVRLGNRFMPVVELTCQPYDVFRCPALTANEYARVDTDGTLTGSTLTTTQTGSLTITNTNALYACTTLAADFPVDVMISGERITLSGIVDTGTLGTQTATISARSVNGVVKSHAVGESITAAEPNYWQFR